MMEESGIHQISNVSSVQSIGYTRNYSEDVIIPVKSGVMEGGEQEQEQEEQKEAHVFLEPTWVTSMKETVHRSPSLLKESSGGRSCCIHRVPNHFCEGNEKAYIPNIISIGPFHRGKKSLQAMEEHKGRYLRLLFPPTRDDSFETCLRTIKKLETRARECYSETIDLNSDDFVEMLVMDGCFIIVLFRLMAGQLPEPQDDPIFNMRWIMPSLVRDLLMLENQLPFFILQSLFDLTNTQGNGGSPLSKLALNFFKVVNPCSQTILLPNLSVEGLHLLHLFHSSLTHQIFSCEMTTNGCRSSIPLVSDRSRTLTLSKNNSSRQLTRSVTELRDAGIKFKKLGGHNFLNIKFDNGVLQIAPLSIQDSCESLFLNLISFEQCYSYCGNHVTTYTTFMDCLINTPKDVEFLRRRGIIENWLGSDDEVANLFNKLGNEVVFDIDPCYLSHIFEEVNRYCRTKWNVWRASLMHNYFYNPWAIISFLAAIVLLILTFIQTIFSGQSLSGSRP